MMAMLKRLRIKNFKGWKDTGIIRMAPITVFFGANSSGKSSIGQFLMMLKQTVESPDRKAVFFPGDINSAVELGSYQKMVYQRNPYYRIGFEYQWQPATLIKIKDLISGKSFTANQILFSSSVGLKGDTEAGSRKICVEKLTYTPLNEDTKVFSIGMQLTAGKKHQYRVETENYPLKRNPGRVWHPGAPVRFYGFPDEVIAYYKNAQFVQSLNLLHETLFKQIFYLGPLRTKTHRLYSWSGITPASVGYSGENTIAAILASRGRKISLGYKKKYRPLEQIVAQSLKNMGLVESFAVESISEQRQDYEVKLRTKGSQEWVDLPDVGFGISQVLPVLVQCFYAPPEAIIIMEQPEIHLHPSAQSALADVIIDVIHSRENGNNRNVQLIIETHSEHFLWRLHQRIVEETLPQEAVSVYFANHMKKPAVLEPFEIDLFGNIRNWPEHFFGNGTNEGISQ